ncbi:radical SAM protein [Nonomuraea sp. NPDC050451]|uniref:radical SAM protein n=1 Tax=Nonomuraea sp. NPDC050451 TaxID=3364364 RepID=UPI0037A00AC4
MQLRMPQSQDSLLVVLKVVGETCNINCHYCYERRKPYGGSQYLKTEDVAKFLDSCGGRPLAIQLHGGEPLLMKRPRMAEIFALLRQYPGVARVAIQTNGILLNEEWLAFFDEQWPGLDIGISLDGDQEGNAHRVDFHDRPTYAKVVQALELCERRGRGVGVIAVVTRRMLGRATEVLDNIAQFGAVRGVKLAPCFDYNVTTKAYATPNRVSLQVLNPDGVGMPGWSTSPMEYAEFILQAYDYWRNTGLYSKFSIEPFVSVIRSIAGLLNGYESFSDRKCPFVVTLYPDGRIGTTDEIDLPQSLIGSMDTLTTVEELIDYRANPALLHQMQRLLDKCTGCSHQSTCRGGMLSERIPYEGTVYEKQYCDARKRIIDHVSEDIARIKGEAARAHA